MDMDGEIKVGDVVVVDNCLGGKSSYVLLEKGNTHCMLGGVGWFWGNEWVVVRELITNLEKPKRFCFDTLKEVVDDKHDAFYRLEADEFLRRYQSDEYEVIVKDNGCKRLRPKQKEKS